MSAYLQRFAEAFASLDGQRLDTLETLYSEDVTFKDPLHQVHGLAALQAYFTQLYANTHGIHYTFSNLDEVQPGRGYLQWSLQFHHPRLANGRTIHLQGCSHLQWRDRVHFHQDYFDVGALLYEHVPLVGGAVRWLKGRLA